MAHSGGGAVVYSSGVAFKPPSKHYWRINNEWYDLTSFPHPGGKEVLLLARDRFDDCTWVFESHHHNFRRAKLIESTEWATHAGSGVRSRHIFLRNP